MDTPDNGPVAVITGGASGIGAACCRIFVEHGYRVIIADIQENVGQGLALELSRIGTAEFIRVDVSCESDIQSAVDFALENEKFGRLDCILNNAAICGSSGGIEETTLEEFDQVLGVVLRGVYLGIRCAAPIMKKQKFGCIINTASVAGLRAGFGGHIYSAAKAGVIHLTRTVAMELGEHGIRVNCICPGAVATPIFGKALGLPDELANSTDLLESFLEKTQPIPRACKPDDIANAAVWLAGDAAAYINGHALVVDGGMAGGQQWSATQKGRQKLFDALTKSPGAPPKAIASQ